MADGTASEVGIDGLKLAIDHSWAWFALHANQRMQLVNFFIVSAAFITAGYASSMSGDRSVVAGFIAAGGVCVSLAFARLDSRTRELVRISELALGKLEEQLMSLTGVSDLDFVAKIERPARRWTSYGFVIRFLTSALGLLFAFGSAYAFGWG